MGRIVVNAIGEQCPIPVVKVTRALRSMTEAGELEIRVDNEIAVQNLTRMAAGHKLAVRAEKLAERLEALYGADDKKKDNNKGI